MFNRIVFPIFQDEDLVGFAGRLIPEIKVSEKIPKWLILGKKTNFSFPFHLNYRIIQKSKSVILVESIGDCLALWNAGFRNVLVLFGLSLGKGIYKKLIANAVNTVYISLNIDENERGQSAAKNLYKQLKGSFDRVEILEPPKNDWGDCSKQEIREYLKEQKQKMYDRE